MRFIHLKTYFQLYFLKSEFARNSSNYNSVIMMRHNTIFAQAFYLSYFIRIIYKMKTYIMITSYTYFSVGLCINWRSIRVINQQQAPQSCL